MEDYHDNEWGIPVHDDKKQFEFLMLEVMQCGLSWGLMLKKREIFRSCFDGFDYDKIVLYGEEDISRIMETPGMIKSRRKIEAIIHNAKLFQDMRREFGSFSEYLWAFSENCTLVYSDHQLGTPVAKNSLSDAISKDLRKRGFKYLGSVTVYSHLQACGMINDHSADCFLYREINEHNPVKYVTEQENG